MPSSSGLPPQWRVAPRGGSARPAEWSLLEVALPGFPPLPLGVMLADKSDDRLFLRLRSASEVEEALDCGLEEQERDVLDLLGADLAAKAEEGGASAVFAALEDAASHFLRVGDRTGVLCAASPGREADRLFDLHVDTRVGRFTTHLPLYELEAAATKFGESFGNAPSASLGHQGGPGDDGGAEWIRVPEGTRTSQDMFVARVVGRSMEPRIPDGSLCVFRHGVAGSRQGLLLLVELFDETDFASRYTVKRYASRKTVRMPQTAEFGYDAGDGGGGEDMAEWAHASIRLEPLNREFEAFELAPDRFRVVAEFISVLGD